MFGGSETYHSRGMRKDDGEMIRAFLAKAPLYATILMRKPAEDYASFPGWWRGSLNQDRELRALACVEGTAGNIYGVNHASIVELASEMLRAARTNKSGPRNAAHQLLGEAEVMESFWEVFHRVGKTVLHDKKRDLVGATTIDPVERPSFSFGRATRDDFKIVYEYAADATLERWGLDPRRAGRQRHEQSCMARIESGNLLLARDKGKPVFIADLGPQFGDVVLLSNIFVPRPFRRRKIVAASLTAAHAEALKEGKEMAFFADQDDEKLQKAVKLCGFETRCTYRLIVMR